MKVSQLENIIPKLNKQAKVSLQRYEEGAGYADPRSQHLHFMTEVANLLIMDKSMVAEEKSRKEIFQKLNIVQISHIVKSFKTDEYRPMKFLNPLLAGCHQTQCQSL